jgi:hypothetical protein
MKITPLVFDMVVDSRQLLDCLSASVAGFPSATDFSLYPAKLGLCSFIIPGIFDGCAVTQDSKASNPHINTSHFAGFRQWRRVRNNDTKTGMPLPARSSEGHGFDAARNFPVKLHLQLTNTHDVELVILSELAPIPIRGESVAVKPGQAFKSGIACFLPLLDSAKERLKRSVHLAQDSLTTHVIY